MRLRHSTCARALLGALALAVVATMVPGEAQASNMGFKMNKQICADLAGANVGRNLVSLPFRNPYQTAADVCTALNLAPAPGFNILQVRAVNGQQVTYRCGDLNPFQLQEPPGTPGQGLKRNGVVVFNPGAANGILVGSHQSGLSNTLFPRGGSPTTGDNYFPILYHTTAQNAEDVCVDLGLQQTAAPKTTVITRINACTGLVLQHFCGDLGAFSLVLGEAVKIEFNSPPNPNPLPVAAGHPAHF